MIYVYKWILEIVHQQNGETRVIEKQDSLLNIAKWEKEIIKSDWKIITLKKKYT